MWLFKELAKSGHKVSGLGQLLLYQAQVKFRDDRLFPWWLIRDTA